MPVRTSWLALMQRQHTGRPGTKVIPDGWGASHRGPWSSAGPLASTIRSGSPSTEHVGVERGPRPDRDRWSGPDPVYDGPASLMAVSDTARALTVVEDPVKTRVYDVTLPSAPQAGR
jgi:hypothetical protein